MNLADLGRKKFVSQSALSELLKELKSLDELPAATSRSSVKRARDEKMKIQTPVGPLFATRSLAANDGAGQMRNGFCLYRFDDCLFHVVITGMMTRFDFQSVYQTLQVMLNAPLSTLVCSCGTSAEILNHLVISWKQR